MPQAVSYTVKVVAVFIFIRHNGRNNTAVQYKIYKKEERHLN